MAVSSMGMCVAVVLLLMICTLDSSCWPHAVVVAGDLQYDQLHQIHQDQNSSSSCNIKSRPVQPRDSNFLCRTLGRCLLQSTEGSPAQAPLTMLPTLPTDPDASSILASPPPPQVVAGDPSTFPTLPTDPGPAASSSNSSPPSPDPSTGPTDSSSLSPPAIVGDPNSGSTSTTSSAKSAAPSTSNNNIGAKIGLSAGVGVTGVIMVIVGLLYYFKPDVFMCCRTCVRVQIFHHNPTHAIGKNNHSTV